MTAASDIAACRELLRGGSRTFFAASLVLPRAVSDPAIALAQHKPGDRDGLPRMPAPTVPQPDSKIKSGADAGQVDRVTNVLIG